MKRPAAFTGPVPALQEQLAHSMPRGHLSWGRSPVSALRYDDPFRVVGAPKLVIALATKGSSVRTSTSPKPWLTIPRCVDEICIGAARMCSLSSGSTARRLDQVGWPQRCGAEVVRSGIRIGSSCPRASAGASIPVGPIQTTSSETLVSSSRTRDMPRTNFLALYRDATVGLDTRCAQEFGARSERSGSARPTLTSLPRTARSWVAEPAHPASSRPVRRSPEGQSADRSGRGEGKWSIDVAVGLPGRYRGADGARLP
jgi:hypothetical protein